MDLSLDMPRFRKHNADRCRAARVAPVAEALMIPLECSKAVSLQT